MSEKKGYKKLQIILLHISFVHITPIFVGKGNVYE